MSVDTENREEVFPCHSCASPVFDDELFCEACGMRLSEPDDLGDQTALRRGTDREERDLGVMASVSDRGKRRPRNEDAMASATVGGRFAAVVCDGVASTANPDLAAQAAAHAAMAVLAPLLYAGEWPAGNAVDDLMNEAFLEAQREVVQVPEDEPGGNDLSPSTTMVAAVAISGRIVVGSVGDSRAYWLTPDRTGSAVLTVDDSWAQERIAEGQDPRVAYADPDAHTITRWIGNDAQSVAPNLATFEVTEDGLLILCTDGLWNYFEVAELADLASGGPSTPLAIARRLTDAALAAGGHDNVTVAVVPLGPADGGTA
jgi:serine/threonine protein phosphatase PrpC